MDVICNECRSQPACNDIRRHDQWNEEAGSIDIHTRQSGDHLRASQDETGSDKHVGRKAVEQVGQVSYLAMASEDDLGEAVDT